MYSNGGVSPNVWSQNARRVSGPWWEDAERIRAPRRCRPDSYPEVVSLTSEHDAAAPLDGSASAISRRTLLKAAGSGALALGFSGVLAACGSSSSSSSASGSSSSASGTPKRGGTLKVGTTGGGPGDTLEAQLAVTNADIIRAGALFEQLVIVDPTTGANAYVLAESIEPNKHATEWTIRIRPDVKWHDGTSFSSKDVLYSFKRIQKTKSPGAVSFGSIDLGAAKVMDKRTLRIPFDRPFVVFDQGLAQVVSNRMVPEGYDPKKPIGTGPFKFKSFTPGQQSNFVRFDDYWQHGKPYLDELIIIDFADETAQVNALQSAQVQLIDQLSATSVNTVKSASGKVVISKTDAFTPFFMSEASSPFNDVRVRQAMRLIPDRTAYNEQVFGGLGKVGNDVFGVIDHVYDGLLPQREQDIEQAKSLLKSAGQSNLRVNLYSANVGAGAQSGASVLASQAKAAGVTINIVSQDATTYYANSYGKVPLGMSFWNAESYLLNAQQAVAKNAPYNEIHQSNARWQSLYNKAIGIVDAQARGEVVKEMMRFDYAQGGYLLPVFLPNIEGMTTAVNGVTQNINGFPINGGAGWQEVSLDA